MTQTPEKSLAGTVVTIVGDQLTTSSRKGNERCYTLTKDAKVTCDGQPSNAADLKTGTHVRVTVKTDDRKTAIAIDSGKHITGTVTALKV
jgi:hypothetical protein